MNVIPEFCEYDATYLKLIEDLLDCDRLLEMDQIVHHYHTTRLRHSFFVSYQSYTLAKKYGLDDRAIARAGLLHDFFLESPEEVLALGQGSHNLVHPKLALKNASKIIQLSEMEKDIILSHMFFTCLRSPRPRYKESWLVCMVDKYCAIGEFFIPVHTAVEASIKKMRQWLVFQQ